MQRAILAAGCFWGVEARFRQLPGVLDAVCGYTGGHVEHPSYEVVCRGDTGHAEAVEISFDEKQLSFEALLKYFFESHNPTTLNQQGPDKGSQYRSAIFYLNDEQRQIAEAMIDSLTRAKRFERDIVTEVAKAGEFYRAEEYHQRYFEKHPNAGCSFGE